MRALQHVHSELCITYIQQVTVTYDHYSQWVLTRAGLQLDHDTTAANMHTTYMQMHHYATFGLITEHPSLKLERPRKATASGALRLEQQAVQVITQL